MLDAESMITCANDCPSHWVYLMFRLMVIAYQVVAALQLMTTDIDSSLSSYDIGRFTEELQNI